MADAENVKSSLILTYSANSQRQFQCLTVLGKLTDARQSHEQLHVWPSASTQDGVRGHTPLSSYSNIQLCVMCKPFFYFLPLPRVSIDSRQQLLLSVIVSVHFLKCGAVVLFHTLRIFQAAATVPTFHDRNVMFWSPGQT